MMTPYRSDHRVPAWLIRIDRHAPLRSFQWYRERIGGVWVLLWFHLMPAGGYEDWHSETLDASVRTHTKVLKREVYL